MSDSRTRIWFSLFVLGVFGLGLATGLFMGRRMGPPPHLAPAGPPVVRGPMGGGNQVQMIERLERLLLLSDEQRAKIEDILDERGGRLIDINREAVSRAAEERSALLAEIRGVLTPPQQRRFDRWVENAPAGRGRGRGRQ